MTALMDHIQDLKTVGYSGLRYLFISKSMREVDFKPLRLVPPSPHAL